MKSNRANFLENLCTLYFTTRGLYGVIGKTRVSVNNSNCPKLDPFFSLVNFDHANIMWNISDTDDGDDGDGGVGCYIQCT